MKWFIGPCSIQCYRGSIKDGLCFRFHTFCNVFMQLDSFIGAIELSSDKWAQVPRSRVNSEMSHLSVLCAGRVMKCCAYAGTKLIWPNVKNLAVEIQIHKILENNISGFTTVLLVCTRLVTQIYFVFPSFWCRWLSATTGFFKKKAKLSCGLLKRISSFPSARSAERWE